MRGTLNLCSKYLLFSLCFNAVFGLHINVTSTVHPEPVCLNTSTLRDLLYSMLGLCILIFVKSFIKNSTLAQLWSKQVAQGEPQPTRSEPMVISV